MRVFLAGCFPHRPAPRRAALRSFRSAHAADGPFISHVRAPIPQMTAFISVVRAPIPQMTAFISVVRAPTPRMTAFISLVRVPFPWQARCVERPIVASALSWRRGALVSH